MLNSPLLPNKNEQQFVFHNSVEECLLYYQDYNLCFKDDF